MKKSLLLLLLSILCVVPTFADSKSCKIAYDKALELFHSGQYYDAKIVFTAISDECGKNYRNVDAMLQLCNYKLKELDVVLYIDDSDDDSSRKLQAGEGYVRFDVTCYGEYQVLEMPYWCEILEISREYFEIGYQPNTTDSVRTGNIVVEGGGQTIVITLVQPAMPKVEEPIEQDTIIVVIVPDTVPEADTVAVEVAPEPAIEPLSVSTTSISAIAAGKTEYIDVTCGKEWEIQYASGSMYSASRVGDRVKVKILPNNTYSSRSDYFYIRTKDESESFKITLSQLPAAQPTSSSSTTSSSYTSSTPVYMSAYDRYCADQGSFEVTWFGTNFSIGTGFEYSISALRLRWGWIQLNPIELSIGVDFLEMMGTSLIYSYQPSLNFVIPASENEAVYIGAGPVVGNYMWFKAEAGYRFHWGENASSDIFFRYDGTVTIGVSIQCSSHN